MKHTVDVRPKIVRIEKDFTVKNVEKISENKKTSQSSPFILAKYMNVGYYLVIPLLLGVFFGIGVDAFFKTKSVFTISGIVIGSVGTMYNLIKLTKTPTK